MTASPWVIWLPAHILIPWIVKCLCELLLLRVALGHRVRYVWALALYTFTTTLMLMVMAEARYAHYWVVDKFVSWGGGATMVLVALGLAQLLRRGRREYGKLMLVYILLCASQVVLHVAPPKVAVVSLVAQWSWPIFILWLAYECHWMPWLRLSMSEVAWLMTRDVLG